MASRTTFQLFGRTERDILEILWRDGPCTTRQIVEAIEQTRPTAYTTIKTVTEALLKKGFITRRRWRRAGLELLPPDPHPPLDRATADPIAISPFLIGEGADVVPFQLLIARSTYDDLCTEVCRREALTR